MSTQIAIPLFDRFTALDGIPREVSVTGLPLLSHADELVGSVSLFWQPGSDERPG